MSADVACVDDIWSYFIPLVVVQLFATKLTSELIYLFIFYTVCDYFLGCL